MPTPPTFADVQAAAERIRGHAHRTPVLTSHRIDTDTGARLFFKCENFQRMGAFKFRGAFNALSRFDEDQRRAGVGRLQHPAFLTIRPYRTRTRDTQPAATRRAAAFATLQQLA